ncbi:MAG: signal peptidase I [Oscillospiraceae bacterium]|nr:signal peptidase I [Oscillospiraceae bacterium]
MEQFEHAEVEEKAVEETTAVNEETTSADEETEEAEETSGKAEKKIDLSEFREIINTMLVSVFVVLMVFTYLARPVTVQGGSMKSTLQPDDKLLMYRLFYEPKQGDIVVINNTMGHLLSNDGQVVESGASLNKTIIKRVIATEGQTLDVDVVNDAVYVDGVALPESYINEFDMQDAGVFNYPITIPEGYIFVMGDNRNHSTDSRSSTVGLVDVNDVLGKTYFRYAPFGEFGFLN